MSVLTYGARSLGDLPLNVHQLRATKAGREVLRSLGKPALEPAKHYQQRPSRSKNRTAPFIGWDGEGMEVDGTHRYTLLANSNGRHIASATGLTTYECLDFITSAESLRDCGKSINVMFSGGYDANMILGDLSLSQIRVLTRNGSVRWGTFRIKYRPGRYLKVYRLQEPFYIEGIGKSKGKWNVTSSLDIFDVWGFFQHSFVAALKEWGVGEEEQVKRIKDMKLQRGVFTKEMEEAVMGYCHEECTLLAELCEELRRNFLRVGYIPKSWTGPGALGAAVLDKHKVRKFGDRSLADGVGPVAEAAMYAFFGGRIEPIRYGRYVGTVYAHDIVSAYPAGMVDLPCLAHGEWSNTPEIDPLHPFSVHHLANAHSADALLHPLPHRTDDGRVVFPSLTTGWYWRPEATQASFLQKEHEMWTWYQSCDHKPFAFVEGLFNARREMKKVGNPAQLSLKLVLNSLYGKLCQRLGGDTKAPPYHQLEWAGYITSRCRASVYALAMHNPSAVISFETDGVYATAPLCEDGDGSLGSWEVTTYDEIVYVTSGMYWLRKGDKWTAKYRGLDNGSLQLDDVLTGWRDGVSHVEASRTRFRGMFTSVISPERFGDWGEWITEDPRPRIALYPAGKRLVVTDEDPSLGLQPTMAAQPKVLHSHPHKLPWRNGSYPLQLATDQEGREEMEEDW